MPEVSTLDAIVEGMTVAQYAPEQEDEVIEDEAQEDEAPEQEDKDDRQLNILLLKCERAFTKGLKGLLLSRVECGKWAHAVYALRSGQDRKFTSTLIFNRLAIHADNPRECDADKLARMYKLVEL